MTRFSLSANPKILDPSLIVRKIADVSHDTVVTDLSGLCLYWWLHNGILLPSLLINNLKSGQPLAQLQLKGTMACVWLTMT